MYINQIQNKNVAFEQINMQCPSATDLVSTHLSAVHLKYFSPYKDQNECFTLVFNTSIFTLVFNTSIFTWVFNFFTLVFNTLIILIPDLRRNIKNHVTRLISLNKNSEFNTTRYFKSNYS